MKRILKYTGYGLLAFFFIIFLIFLLLYIPPVRNLVKNKVLDYVNAGGKIHVEVEEFGLKFPLDLELKKVFVGQSEKDTLVYADYLSLDMGLRNILKHRVLIHELQLRRVRVNVKNKTTGMKLDIRTKALGLAFHPFDWDSKEVRLRYLDLNNGHVVLTSGSGHKSVNPEKKPFDWIFGVEELRLDSVSYTMYSSSMPYLGSGIEKGRITRAKVDIGREFVNADSVNLKGGGCSILIGKADRADKGPVVNTTKGEWEVRVNNLYLSNSRFELNNSEKKAEKFEIALSGIGVLIDSVYNRSRIVKGNLRELTFVQDSGIYMKHFSGHVDLDSAASDVVGLRIITSHTNLVADAALEAPVGDAAGGYPFRVSMKGSVGLSDIVPFYDGIPDAIRSKRLNVDASLVWSKEYLSLRKLKLDMGNRFSMEARGNLESLNDIENITGSLELHGRTDSTLFIRKGAKNREFNIPAHTEVYADFKAYKGKIAPVVRIGNRNALLSVLGYCNLISKEYDISIRADSFPVQRFIPGDIGRDLSGRIKIRGKGYDWRRAVVDAEVDIDGFVYNKHRYTDIFLKTMLSNTTLKAHLISDDPDCILDLSVKADKVDSGHRISLDAKIPKLDFQRLNFSEEIAKLSCDFSFSGFLGSNEYGIRTDIKNIFLNQRGNKEDLGDIKLEMHSDVNTTLLKINSGDFDMRFAADTTIMHVTELFAEAGRLLTRQIRRGTFDMEDVRQIMPYFKLDIEGGYKNAVMRYLAANNIKIRRLDLNASSLPARGFQMLARVKYPMFGEVQFDSVCLEVCQHRKTMDYRLIFANSDRRLKDMFNLQASGYFRRNLMRIFLNQKNTKGDEGIDLGADIALQDSSFSVRLFPYTPVIGYEKWTVNEDNWVNFGRNLKLSANMKLENKDKVFEIRSEYDSIGNSDKLDIKIENINIKKTASNIPLLPAVEGVLRLNAKLASVEGHMYLNGNIGIDDFVYESNKVGDVDLKLDYLLDKATYSLHEFITSMHIDGHKGLDLRGRMKSGRKMAVDVNSSLNDFPLSLVNIFLPKNTLSLKGGMDGNLFFKGNLKEPELSGELAFKNAKVKVSLLSTEFGIDSNRLDIRNGRLNFRNFKFIAPNNSALLLNGDLHFQPFDKMKANLVMSGRQFQVVDVGSDENSILSGKGFADITARMRGYFKELDIRGSLKLLSGTEINYAVRENVLKEKGRLGDVVRFVSFRDSLNWEVSGGDKQFITSGFTMNMFMDIEKGVKMNIDLSENGDNKVSLVGGGGLTYSIDKNGISHLSGKYILSQGEVRYTIPVVAQKTFNISDGSYVEWTGDIVKPMLNISASEYVKANVISGNQSRLVTFNAIIRIGNTLADPSIAFDVEAVHDQVVQSQLATLNKDERSREAINLLVYNTYMGPGQVQTLKGGALNSILESELNQWTRKYFNTGLTFGIDTYDQYSSRGRATRTDVSYKFSKNLFNEKVRVKIGGKLSASEDPNRDLEQTLVDDIALEYVFDRNKNLFLRFFRNSNYDILEGNVFQTGGGVVFHKNFANLLDFFRSKKKRALLQKKRDDAWKSLKGDENKKNSEHIESVGI